MDLKSNSDENKQEKTQDSELNHQDIKLTRERLLILPKHELVAILKRIYKKKREKIQNRYVELRDRKIISKKSIWEYLEEFGIVDVLIEMIIEKLDKKIFERIESLYVEYQHGSYPTFYFIKISPPLALESIAEKKQKLIESIDIWNFEAAESNLPSIRNIQLKIFNILEQEEIIEIEFFYEYLIPYISPEDYQPCHIYAHETNVIWLSFFLEYFIIKARGRSIRIIKDILATSFNCKIEGVSLPQKIVDAIFNEDSIRSATFEDPIKSEDKVERHTVTDRNLSKKPLYRRLHGTSDRKRSTHETMFLNSLKMAQVLKEGKISVRGKFRKSLIRKESINLLKKIELAIISLKDKDFITYVGTKNPEDSEVLSVIRTKLGRNLVYNLAHEILKMSDKHKTELLGTFEIEDYARHLKDFFLSIIDTNCVEIDCIGQIICLNCENTFNGLLEIKRKHRIYCSTCKENIELNKNHSFSCGHESATPLPERMSTILLPGGRRLINQFYVEIGAKFQIPDNQVILISHSTLQIIVSDFTSIVDLTELSGFNRIPKINDLSLEIIKTQTEIIDSKLGEKCQYHGAEKCRSCLREYHGNCVQRVVCHFARGSLWPHSPVERGDFEINVDYMSRKWKILGIAKASNGGKTLTRSKDDRLLGQVLLAILYHKTHFIMVASGANLDPTLRDIIERVCILYKVKLVYFFKDDLIRSYPTYRKEVKNRYGRYKPVYR